MYKILLYIILYDTDRTENTEFNSSPILPCVFVVAGTYLMSRRLAMYVSYDSTNLTFRH
jgi:hypothetical protein